MKTMLYAALVVALAVAGLSLWVRLAPSDTAYWNAALPVDRTALSGPCAQQISKIPKGAAATCLLPGDPASVLTKLATRAAATPRTTLLSGTPQEGRMTWISRSKLMGYPDYITAQATSAKSGTRLDILSRQRFGSGDRGVNAARLTQWLSSF